MWQGRQMKKERQNLNIERGGVGFSDWLDLDAASLSAV
jgi:hypothetical protein